MSSTFPAGREPLTGKKVKASGNAAKASEEAMCKQDIASQERLATIEDALCELDAAVNK